MDRNVLVNFIIQISIISYLFVLFCMSLFYVLWNIIVIIDIIYFIAFFVMVFFIFANFLTKIITGRIFRLQSSLVIFLLSISISLFVFLIQKYTFNEYIIVICYLVGFFVVIFLITVIISNIKVRIILFGLITVFTIILYVLINQKPFFWTGILFLVFSGFSFYSIKNSAVNIGHSLKYKIFQSKRIKYLLIGIVIFSGCYLVLPVRVVEIRATNSPELIFWTDGKTSPTDEETLQYCYDHDIGFSVALTERYISDGGATELRHIEALLNHSIITYIAIGGESKEFYLSTDNGDEFYDYFKSIKDWMQLNNIYKNINFKGFVFDAETPRTLIEEFEDKSALEKTQYFVENIPSSKRMDKIESVIKDIKKECDDDGKELGIIKLPTMFDESDNEYDYSRLSKNIYELDIPWDFSSVMLYRTQHIPNIYDYIIKDMNDYDYNPERNDLGYLEQSQLDRNVVSLSTFYQKVSYEVSTSEVNVPKSDRYIFIGNFHEKFEDTSYIKNEEYKKDLDICRSFGVKSVWLYEWVSFKDTYGSNGIKDLVKHNENRQYWVMYIPYYMITRELIISVFVVFIDKIIILGV